MDNTAQGGGTFCQLQSFFIAVDTVCVHFLKSHAMFRSTGKTTIRKTNYGNTSMFALRSVKCEHFYMLFFFLQSVILLRAFEFIQNISCGLPLSHESAPVYKKIAMQ